MSDALREKFPERRKSFAIFAGILVILACALASAQFVSTGTSSSPLVSDAQAIIVPKAIGNYGKWYIPKETTTGVVSTISEIRNTTGKQLDLFRIVAGPQSSDQTIKGTKVTVNSFLLSAQSAAGGGLVIPELNMNYYTSGRNVTNQSYCDPRNSTNCGPAWFFEVSSELLSLQAVQDKTPRTVYLEAWDQFNRNIQRLGYPSNQACMVLQQLLAQGWQKLLIKDLSGLFSDCGYSAGQVTTVDYQSTNPYLVPATSILDGMPAGEQHFEFFDDQTQPYYLSLSYMLSVMSPGQQVVALTNLFGLQSQDKYTFAVPIFDSINLNGTTYYWDANINTQPNSQPFLGLIESLITSSNSSAAISP